MLDRLRVSAIKEKGEILEFCVQYEAYILENWQAVIRYDTAHGYAHKDTIHFDGKVDKEPVYFVNYNLVFTHATQDLKKNWKKYRQNFELEARK